MAPGLISLEWLLARVTVQPGPLEDDPCWVWNGTLTDRDQPQVSMRTPEGRKTLLVRRLVIEFKQERALPTSLWAYARCETRGCVHPEHLATRTRVVAQGQTGKKRSPAVAAKIAAARRAQSRFDHDELIARIQASDKSNVKLADELGCHHTYVARIRTGEARIDYSNPYVVQLGGK